MQLDYATIEAPISGRTGLLQVHKGNLVRANDTAPIVSINRVTPVYVTFAVPEAMLPQFKRYMAAGTIRVEAMAPNDAGPPSVGKIEFIDIAVDATSGTIKVKGTFPNERSPADARPVRQRQRDADHRPQRDGGADHRPCRAASRARSST